MKAYIINVWQPDCPIVRTSEKFSGDYIKIFVINSRIKSNHVKALIKLSSDNRQVMGKFVNKLSNNPYTSIFQVLSKKGCEVLGLLITREVTKAMKTLDEVAIYYFPFIAYDGIEKWFVLSTMGGGKVLEALSEGGNDAWIEASLNFGRIELLLRGSLAMLYTTDLKKLLKITERQFKAASLALEKGYYSYPRKADLNTLSKELQISKTAYVKLLRKVEKKALSLYLSFINSSKSFNINY